MPYHKIKNARRARSGFTLIEMVIIMAIIAILALLALPSFQDQIIRNQIVEAVALADIAKPRVAATWSAAQVFPTDNVSVGLPVAEKIVNNYISSLAVENGVIQITFGNNVNAGIKGKVLSLRPAIVTDAPIVPVAWVCGNAAAPDKMTVQGINRTDIPTAFLPFNCRAAASK